MSQIKLKDILAESFKDASRDDKRSMVEDIKQYGSLGKSLYNGNNIIKIAEQLSDLCTAAHQNILGENDDWFDKVSVNRNMKNLKGMVKEFRKSANESHQLNQRLTALYEDMGVILNRYYDIDSLSEDKGDMDNDGVNEPDDEEYMDNKDKAIKKAMKKEEKTRRPFDNVGGVVSLKPLGGLRKKF